jgi:hypothetical protein
MQEVWKDIPGYEGMYQVSNLGRVYSMPKEWITFNGGKRNHNGKMLHPQLKNDYYEVRLYNNLYYKTIKVHQLVAMAFLGHVRNGKQDLVVDHIDNNQINNELCNLQIISQRKNSSKDRINNSGFTGVYKLKHNKFRAQIKIEDKQIHLGYFKCALSASVAYYKKLKEIENGK